MLRISPILERWLPVAPEYGMGFHKVVATLSNEREESGFVVNSRLFLFDFEAEGPLRATEWDAMLAEAGASSLRVVRLTLVPRKAGTLRGVRRETMRTEKYKVLARRTELAARQAEGDEKQALLSKLASLNQLAASAAAQLAPVALTSPGEVFKRFLPFAIDTRMTDGHGLTPGTIAVTAADARVNIRTGEDAVTRYGLPRLRSAGCVFTIEPEPDTELRRGTVEPVNAMPLGGEEVIFVNGLPDEAVSGPVLLAGAAKERP